jgi:hypothetical protein
MSHIEAVTKPVLLPLVMLRTDKRTLNTEELGILARWMTLRSMVSDGLFDEQNFTEPNPSDSRSEILWASRFFLSDCT